MTELPLDPPEQHEPQFQAGPVPHRTVRRGPRSGGREPTREALRDGVVVGRDGEILTRKRTTTGDIFDVPRELIEFGWEYQWNAVTVVGNSEVLIDQNLMMSENGWRPVPADRPGFIGRFTAVGQKGSIIRGGQRLDERPAALCDQARAEEYAKATGQIRERDAALTGGKANLRNTLANNDIPINHGGYKGRKTNIHLDIDPDAPRPSYEYPTGDQ